MAFNTKVRGTEQLIAATVTDTQLDAPNANTGTWGDATHVGQFTVSASGRITAAASVAITATVSGSGTTGNITKWSNGASGVLADSIMSESGGTITVGAGSGQVGFTIKGGNAINVGPFVILQRNSINQIFFGTVSSVLGGTSNDAILYGASGNGIQFYTNAAKALTIDTSGNLNAVGKVSTYANVATAGWGVPAIYQTGRVTAQTGTNVTVVSFTSPAADSTYWISGCITTTAYTSGSIQLTLTYTDENGTVNTTTISNGSAVGNSAGPVDHYRVKASTAITIKATGTFVATYNAEAYVTQIG